MSIRIEDGKGSGLVATVNSENRLAVDAIVRDEETKYSGDGYAFGFSSGELPVTATGGRMLWLKNTDADKLFHLDRIWFNWNGGDSNHNRVAFAIMYINDTQPDTNTSAITPVNLNLTKIITANMTVLGWNGTGDGMTGHSAGTPVFYWSIPQGRESIHLGGSMIVGTNNIVSFNFKGEEVGKAFINIVGHFSSNG